MGKSLERLTIHKHSILGYKPPISGMGYWSGFQPGEVVTKGNY
jgi:hypothetical protein